MQPANTTSTPRLHYVGLAPFLRKSIAGVDLAPFAQALLAQAQQNPDDAETLMNLAIALHSTGHRDLGLVMQAQALPLQQTYSLPARRQPLLGRILMLMTPGDLAANTPLECLLEDSDVELIQHFLTSPAIDLAQLPEHDVLFVAVSEDEAHLPLLAALSEALRGWPKPVLNAAEQIPKLARHTVSQTLAGIPGLLAPSTHHLSRSSLLEMLSGVRSLADIAPGSRFPLIIRPVGSQAGRDLARVANPDELAEYLAGVGAEHFFVADFVDYSGSDGLYRKARVVLVDGQPFVAHMAVSDHWMVHYVNAGMYDDAARRAEEARFMNDFAAFAERHALALREIHRRSGLDLLCIDCAETRDGEFLVFEVGNAMVVHAMDPVDRFPYKPPIIAQIVEAFRNLLKQRMARGGA